MVYCETILFKLSNFFSLNESYADIDYLNINRYMVIFNVGTTIHFTFYDCLLQIDV